LVSLVAASRISMCESGRRPRSPRATDQSLRTRRQLRAGGPRRRSGSLRALPTRIDPTTEARSSTTPRRPGANRAARPTRLDRRCTCSGSPPSTTITSSCSTKSGFPAATSLILARVARQAPSGSAGSRPARPTRCARAARGERLAWDWLPRRRGRPDGPRRQQEEQRCVPGPVPRCSSRSSSVGSAQWMSSITSVTGRSRARRSSGLPDRPGNLLWPARESAAASSSPAPASRKISTSGQ